MTRHSLCHFARGLLLAVGLAGCANAPAVIAPDAALQCRADRGSGGTGLVAEDRGIGGTGMVAQDRGIGGTGIIGTVTGFGSICVNGFRVAYDDSTHVTVDGAPARPEVLERGLTVAVTAGPANGRLQASAIDVIHALVGPVTARADATGTFAVMNVPVNGAFAAGSIAETLAVGDIVAIDGLQRPDGTIDATRIAPAPGAIASVRGLTQTAAALSIGGVRVKTAQSSPPDGTWAAARGAYANGVLEASGIVGGVEIGGADRLSVEGYLTPDAAGALSIRGLPVREDSARGLGRGTLARLAAGQRVQILGQRQSDGSLRPETIIVPDRRAPLLEVSGTSPETTATEASRAEVVETPTRAATTITTTVTRPAAAAAAELQTQRGVYGAATVTRPQVLREVEPVVRPNAVQRAVRPDARPDVRPEVGPGVRPEIRPDVRPTRPDVPSGGRR